MTNDILSDLKKAKDNFIRTGDPLLLALVTYYNFDVLAELLESQEELTKRLLHHADSLQEHEKLMQEHEDLMQRLEEFMKRKPLDLVMGVEEAAPIWDLSPGRIKNICNEGGVPAKKVGQTWIVSKLQPSPKQISRKKK